MIDDDYFANCAAMGLSPMIAEGVPHKLKRYLGRVGYLIWAVWCLIRFHPFRLTVDDGSGLDETLWATEVRIANGGFHGGVELVEGAEVDSGEIIIQAVVGRTSLAADLGLVRQIFQAARPPPHDPRVPRPPSFTHRDAAAPAHLDRRRGLARTPVVARSPSARSRWSCRTVQRRLDPGQASLPVASDAQPVGLSLPPRLARRLRLLDAFLAGSGGGPMRAFRQPPWR